MVLSVLVLLIYCIFFSIYANESKSVTLSPLAAFLLIISSFCPLRNLIMHTKMSNGRGSSSHRFYTRIESCPTTVPDDDADDDDDAASAPVVAAFFMLQCVQFV